MMTLSPAGPVPSTVKVNGLRRFGRKPVNVTLPDEPAYHNNIIVIALRGTLAKISSTQHPFCPLALAILCS